MSAKCQKETSAVICLTCFFVSLILIGAVGLS